MIKKLRKIHDNEKVFRAAFTDLSKNSEYSLYKQLIAKLNAYDFDINLPNFILACLTKRKQILKYKNRIQFQ